MVAAPGSALAPDGVLLFLGLTPTRDVITFHFAPPTPPLTGWRDGDRLRWHWSDDNAVTPVPRDRFGPCEKRLLAVTFDPLGVTFHWPGRAPQRYGWQMGRGFLPEETN